MRRNGNVFLLTGTAPLIRCRRQRCRPCSKRRWHAHPDATALLFEDRSLSYGALNAQANRIAHALIARDIGPEDVVALALPRSLDMIVALLGILKSGAAYLPLDPEYPAERLNLMIGDAGPAA